MPLSEFLRLARGKLESGQPRPCPTDLSSQPNDELVELVWENGQIMMQGQSSRVSRNPPLNILSSNRVVRDSRIGKFGGVESFLNDISPLVPTADINLSHDDEMVPWLSYPINDALPQGYGSDLLPELSGITSNGISNRNSFVSVDKSSCGQTFSNLQSGGNNLRGSSSRARPMHSWLPQQSQTSDALGSGASDIISNNTFGSQAEGRDIVKDSTIASLTNNKSNLHNFTRFSRPTNFGQPNSGIESVEVEKGSAASGSNLVRSMDVEQFNSTKKDFDFNVSSSKVANVNARQPVVKVSKELCPVPRTEKETSIKNDKGNIGSLPKGVHDGERAPEQMVDSSSVGSGNSADWVSGEQTHNSKRKFREAEESECHSDDIETESVGVKKQTAARGGNGSKRSRAAEVHNLSERRRRDRINEKMRALQELIPNCNKADKASMLDEAIEYLKTLQLQVQIMSMGAGLCMPPMMFPPGMQHMHPAHYSAMGVGMGMNMGFGMGMMDMTGGGSPGCPPIYPVPPMHFQSPTNFPRIPGQNVPVYGQGLTGSGPRPPLLPLPGRPPMALSALRNEVPNTSQICNAEAGTSRTYKTNQLQARNEVLDQSAENKQGTAAIAPAPTDISKEPGYD